MTVAHVRMSFKKYLHKCKYGSLNHNYDNQNTSQKTVHVSDTGCRPGI